MAKRILIVCTSHEEGLWAEELAAPYYAFKKHGCDVKIASIRGNEIPVAEVSLNPPHLTQDVEALIMDDEAMKQLTESIPLATLNPDDFDAIFMPGGHGVCFDFPGNKPLIDAVASMYASGKVVAAVCHGPCGLVDVTEPDGTPLVQGKKVTGFTDAEEEEVGRTADVPFLLEQRLKELGGTYVSAPNWQAHAVRDGNLVTGQNPASSAAVAKLVLEALGLTA